MRIGDLHFPAKVMAYFDWLQDRPARTRAVECNARVHDEMLAMFPLIHFLKVRSILDIGCGVAAIDARLALAFDTKEIHLIDGDGTLPRQTGYKHDTNAWADVEVGRAMVEANVAKDVKVEVHAPDPEATIPVDLIISLRSWGHHYPVSRYLGLALRSLKPSGGLLLDIRNGTTGAEELMSAGFTLVNRIPDPSIKCRRLLFVRAHA